MPTELALTAMLALGHLLQLALTLLGVYAALKNRFAEAAFYTSFATLVFLVARA